GEDGAFERAYEANGAGHGATLGCGKRGSPRFLRVAWDALPCSAPAAHSHMPAPNEHRMAGWPRACSCRTRTARSLGDVPEGRDHGVREGPTLGTHADLERAQPRLHREGAHVAAERAFLEHQTRHHAYPATGTHQRQDGLVAHHL